MTSHLNSFTFLKLKSAIPSLMNLLSWFRHPRQSGLRLDLDPMGRGSNPVQRPARKRTYVLGSISSFFNLSYESLNLFKHHLWPQVLSNSICSWLFSLFYTKLLKLLNRSIMNLTILLATSQLKNSPVLTDS